MKKATSLRVPSMSCKAFNGRVVMEYLASVARLAATRSGAVGPQRLFGTWKMARLQSGEASFPENPLIPIQALAMSRSLKVLSDFFNGLIFVCRVGAGRWGKILLQNLHLRTALARWFGLTERAPRFMSRSEADEIYAQGMEFIKWHLEAAKVSVRRRCVQKKIQSKPGCFIFW